MITSLYAGILALLFFKVSIDTISARRKNLISLGYGPKNEIIEVVSAHANFAAYVPFLLILVFFLEMTKAVPFWVLHLLAAAFTLGRLLHFMAFKADKMEFKKRILGMHLTLWPLVLLGLLNIYSFVKMSFSF